MHAMDTTSRAPGTGDTTADRPAEPGDEHATRDAAVPTDRDGQETTGGAAGPDDGRRGTGNVRILGWELSHPTWLLVLGVAGGLMLAATIGGILSGARTLVVNLVVSLFLSFGLEPAVKWLSERGMRRGLATGLVFLVGLLLAVGFVAAMLPLVVNEAANLVSNAQDIIDGLVSNAQSLPGDLGDTVREALVSFQQDLGQRVPELTESVTRGALNIGASVVGTVFNLLTIALVTFYMTADAPKMRAALASRLSPRRKREFLEVWDIAIDKTGGYVYSRVLTLIASAVFHTVAFSLIDLDYAVALGAWVGVVSSLVPVVGTYIAGVLPVVIALAGQPSDVIWVLVALTVYQLAENYLIMPRVTAHTLSLHPGVTFVSVLLGASLLGAVGALLAIPAAAIVAALISANAEVHPSPGEVVAAHVDEVGQPAEDPDA